MSQDRPFLVDAAQPSARQYQQLATRRYAMRNILRRPFGTALVALIAVACARPVLADLPKPFIVFGDSLSDSGNAFVILNTVTVPPFQSLVPAAPYARGGLHFSNGSTWIEQLALIDHANPSADPALRAPGVFSNYAVG